MASQITASMDGTLLNWLKNVGDSINKGDVIAIGTVADMQNSTHPKVRQFLDRIAEPAVAEEMDYLQMLTESTPRPGAKPQRKSS